MATLARLPNDVLTARDERPKPENRVEKAVVRVILGLSSATTTQLRTQVKLTPLAYEERRANPIILDQYNVTVSGRIRERTWAITKYEKWPLRAVFEMLIKANYYNMQFVYVTNVINYLMNAR